MLRRHGEKDLQTVHSAEDVKNVIENETNLSYRIKVHTASEIEKIRQKLPKLGPVNKALKIHEIMITSLGQVRSKNLPSDVFYEKIKLKESRRIRVGVTNTMTTTFYTLVHYFHDNKDNAERCCGAFVALEVLKMN